MFNVETLVKCDEIFVDAFYTIATNMCWLIIWHLHTLCCSLFQSIDDQLVKNEW